MQSVIQLLNTRILSLENEKVWRQGQAKAEEEVEAYKAGSSQKALFDSYVRDIEKEVGELRKAMEILDSSRLEK